MQCLTHSMPIHTTTTGAEAIKITRLGMYVNLSMALTKVHTHKRLSTGVLLFLSIAHEPNCDCVKGTLGVATHSNALIADAMHSLSDLLSDFVTLWSVKVARLPPDPKHPYGASCHVLNHRDYCQSLMCSHTSSVCLVRLWQV